ncbi:hypothetical protein J4Q44_G00285800 [Coregonus suidteri]|uniref:Uncharacterized protein n=1 Tax=Coregonus suidteri TaxID=861788 RepID=A0AAN8KX31_9TELE
MVLAVWRGLSVVVMVIVVARGDGGVVVVAVVDGHASVALTGRRLGGVVALVTVTASGVVPVPHVHGLVVSAGVSPGGRAVIYLHLAADGGRRGFLPAGGLHRWVGFGSGAPRAPAGVGTLPHRCRAAPGPHAASSWSTSNTVAVGAFLRLGAPSWGWTIGAFQGLGAPSWCWAVGAFLGFGAPSWCWAVGAFLGFGAPSWCWAVGAFLGFGAPSWCWAVGAFLGLGAPSWCWAIGVLGLPPSHHLQQQGQASTPSRPHFLHLLWGCPSTLLLLVHFLLLLPTCCWRIHSSSPRPVLSILLHWSRWTHWSHGCHFRGRSPSRGRRTLAPLPSSGTGSAGSWLARRPR